MAPPMNASPLRSWQLAVPFVSRPSKYPLTARVLAVAVTAQLPAGTCLVSTFVKTLSSLSSRTRAGVMANVVLEAPGVPGSPLSPLSPFGPTHAGFVGRHAAPGSPVSPLGPTQAGFVGRQAAPVSPLSP